MVVGGYGAGRNGGDNDVCGCLLLYIKVFWVSGASKIFNVSLNEYT